MSHGLKSNLDEPQNVGNLFTENQSSEDQQLSDAVNKDLRWEEYKEHPQPVQLAQTFVYELILKNVYKNKKSFLAFPKKNKQKIKFILLFPHTIMQYCSVPNPMIDGQQ